MNCTHTKYATYGKETYCKKCGMDIEFKPTIKRTKKTKNYYCCKKCAEEE